MGVTSSYSYFGLYRNDPHKYKHDNKTLSKKDERVGVKGKKTREKNHSSV